MTFIFLSSFFLLSFLSYREKLYLQVPIKKHEESLPVFFKDKRDSFNQCFAEKQAPLKELLFAFVMGTKGKIPLSLRRDYQILNLQHLYTPAGLHLSSLILLFSPLPFFFKRGKIWKDLLVGGLCLGLFLLPRFYSLKRMALWKLLSMVGRYFLLHQRKKIPEHLNFIIFILTFLLDFLWGSYNSSPLSFAYGFLFLGIIITHFPRPRIRLPFYLLGGQVLASFFFPFPLYRAAIIFNFLLTFLFDLIYPFLFLGLMLGWCAPVLKLLTFFQNITHFCSHWALESGTFESSLPMILFFSLSTFWHSYRTGPIKGLLILSLFIHAENLYNSPIIKGGPSSLVRKIIYPLPSKDEFLHGDYAGGGLDLEYQDRTCLIQLKNDFWEDKCRPLKGRAKGMSASNK